MCIHNRRDLTAYDEYLAKLKSPKRTISIISSQGTLIAGWPVDYSDSQMIANTIRDLKAWHPVEGAWIDLSSVNKARGEHGLELLDSNGLPFPVGDALSQDMDVDLIMRDRDGFTQFEKGLQRYIQAQKEQIQAVATKIKSPVLDSIQVPVVA